MKDVTMDNSLFVFWKRELGEGICFYTTFFCLTAKKSEKTRGWPSPWTNTYSSHSHVFTAYLQTRQAKKDKGIVDRQTGKQTNNQANKQTKETNRISAPLNTTTKVKEQQQQK